jgi:hypothetical protein
VRPFECDKARVQLQEKLGSKAGFFADMVFPAVMLSIGKGYKKE